MMFSFIFLPRHFSAHVFFRSSGRDFRHHGNDVPQVTPVHDVVDRAGNSRRSFLAMPEQCLTGSLLSICVTDLLDFRVLCSFLFIFLTPHLSANVFLPDLRQKHADDDSGRNMIGKNMGIRNLVDNDVFLCLFTPSFFCQCFPSGPPAEISVIMEMTSRRSPRFMTW